MMLLYRNSPVRSDDNCVIWVSSISIYVVIPIFNFHFEFLSNTYNFLRLIKERESYSQKFSVEVSVFEVYNNEIRDLLGDPVKVYCFFSLGRFFNAVIEFVN